MQIKISENKNIYQKKGSLSKLSLILYKKKVKKILKYFFEKYKFVRGDLNLNNRTGMLHKCWGHIFSNHLFGDYIEFGVYKGDTLIQSVYQYQQFKTWLENQKKDEEEWRTKVALGSPLNKKIFFHGLDSFKGMPENNEKFFVFNKGNFEASFEEVEKRVAKLNEKIFLYKGLFAETANQLKENLSGRKISIANIDCDIYSSTVESLNIVNNYLQIGSIILLDDYNSFNADNNKGQRRAIAEFKIKGNWRLEPFFSYMFSGQSFLICGRK